MVHLLAHYIPFIFVSSWRWHICIFISFWIANLEIIAVELRVPVFVWNFIISTPYCTPIVGLSCSINYTVISYPKNAVCFTSLRRPSFNNIIYPIPFLPILFVRIKRDIRRATWWPQLLLHMSALHPPDLKASRKGYVDTHQSPDTTTIDDHRRFDRQTSKHISSNDHHHTSEHKR